MTKMDGIPLEHLTLRHQLEAICNYQYPYMLFNETDEQTETNTTPVVDSVFLNPDILNGFALPTTVAIPIKKAHRNIANGIIVGRDAKADIPIMIPSISVRHAAFHKIGKTWYIEDLGSRNGTYLNNERIEPGDLKKLTSQEVISFGGNIGCAFIEAIDLEMLCSMLIEYWDKINSETHTRRYRHPLNNCS